MTVSGPPVIRDDRSAAFFDAAADEALVTKRCQDCHHWLGLDARTCSSCGSSTLLWENVSGRAELVTWSVVHYPPHPSFAEQVPFPIGLVQLDEGPWINARVVADLDALRAGLPLEVAFVHPNESDSYPVFVTSEGN